MEGTKIEKALLVFKMLTIIIAGIVAFCIGGALVSQNATLIIVAILGSVVVGANSIIIKTLEK